jgi:hypothetical protein
MIETRAHRLQFVGYVVCPKRNRTFFLKHLLISWQLNKTCLLQSIPVHCPYAACNVPSTSATCFAGQRSSPVANSLLSVLPSDIGDLLRVEHKRVCTGQMWGVGRLWADSRLVLRRKFADKGRRVSKCAVVVRPPGLVSAPPKSLPSIYLPQTLLDLQVELPSDCLTTWNKLMMKDALPITKSTSS